MEQRRHRPLRAVRAQLHSGEAGRHDRHRERGQGQRAVPDLPPVLELPCRQGSSSRSAGLHQPRAAHELRVGREERRVPAQAPRGAQGPPPVRRHGVQRGPRGHPLLGADNDHRPPQAAKDRGDAHRCRHRRRLRGAHPGADRPPHREWRRPSHRAHGDRPQEAVRRHLDPPRARRGGQDPIERVRTLRLRRRGGRGALAAAEVGHPRGPWIRRIPGQRAVPPHRQA